MIRRPPRSTLDRSSAASDVYKRQVLDLVAAVGVDRAAAVVEAFEAGEVDRLADRRDDKVGGDAVSYTHLPAHETVLELVCRLLLEKKKNYPKPITVNVHKQSV